jgi:tungstate transport system ATP-binding protein
MIQADGLSKAYGEKEILREISFSVREKEIFGLIGPSGSGKSTLLRLLDLIEMPTGGSLTLLGEDALDGDARFGLRRRLAMLSQKPVIFNRTVYDNIALGMRYRNESQATIGKRVGDALRDIGLPDYARRNARTLSGGEAQRVALARAMVTDPEVLFLDEPTANLDPGAVKAIEQLIATIHAAGTKIVMTTHDLGQARRLADEILFMHQGRVLERRPAEAFFEQPATEEARAFIAGQLTW